jgi:S1-C subfamily serine protease
VGCGAQRAEDAFLIKIESGNSTLTNPGFSARGADLDTDSESNLQSNNRTVSKARAQSPFAQVSGLVVRFSLSRALPHCPFVICYRQSSTKAHPEEVTAADMHRIQPPRLLFWAAILFLASLAAKPWLELVFIQYAAEPRAVTARGVLADDELATIEIFDSASPSVVYISTTGEWLSPWTRNLTEVRRGTGTGLVWDTRGHIVTNFHVIEDARSARVRLSDGRTYNAEFVGASVEHDLAVLRIGVSLARIAPLAIGSSADLRVGQKVFAIGNPFGFDYSLTTGVVSALDRTIVSERHGEIRRLIQTDAAINPGNSGGPLLDSAGRLIGVNTAIFSPSGSYSGIGFAVPVDTVNRVVPQLIANGRYVRPRIGIYGDDDISRPILAELGLEGVLVLRVEPDSPADRAGLIGTRIASSGEIVPGDIIQTIDGEPVMRMSDLIEKLEHYRTGDQVTLELNRGGASIAVAVTLGGRYQQLD